MRHQRFFVGHVIALPVKPFYDPSEGSSFGPGTEPIVGNLGGAVPQSCKGGSRARDPLRRQRAPNGFSDINTVGTYKEFANMVSGYA